MTFEPALHLHFEISNRCEKFCPRVFSCCCCCDSDDDEYLVRRDGKLEPVSAATKKARRKANRRLYENVIPKQVGEDTWESIRGRVCEISGVCIDDEIEKGKPVTKDKLRAVAKAVDEIILEMSTDSTKTED